MVILIIITFVSIRGYVLFRERNLGTISFAFGILAAYGVLVCINDFIIGPTGRIINMWNQEELSFLSLVDSFFTFFLLLIPFAITLLIYSFYREKSNREYILGGKKMALIIAILIFSMVMLFFFGPYEFSMLGFSTKYFTQVWQLLDSESGYYIIVIFAIWSNVIAILLLFLVYGMAKKYSKTKNRNMLWVIVGFSFLLLVFAMPSDLIDLIMIRDFGFQDGDGLLFISYSIYMITYGFLVLSYVSFLISLIKTRRVKQ